MAAVGAASGWIAKTAVKYGMKYGPLVFEAVKHGREPAQRAVRGALARQADRRRAHRHGETLVDGMVLRVFREGEPVWVAFSGDTPVAAYPSVEVPLPTLLEHADLSQRVRPNSGVLRGRRLPSPGPVGKLPDPKLLVGKLPGLRRRR